MTTRSVDDQKIAAGSETLDLKLSLSLAFSMTLWASAFAAIRVGLAGGYSPENLALLRFGSASVALLLYALIKPMRLPRRDQWVALLFASFAGIPLYHIALNYAEVTVTAGVASLMINTSPVFAAILAGAFLGEKLRARGWIGTAISFCGAAVIAMAAERHFRFEPRAAWVLVSAFAGAVYTVIQKRILRYHTPLEFVSYTIWGGTAMMLFLLPGLLRDMSEASAAATWAGVYLGVFPAALAYIIWAQVVAVMQVSRAVVFLYSVPVLAVIIAWIWLGEVPQPGALLGGALVIVGVALVNRRRRRVPEPAL